ncbi:MAG: tRNA pseudouridine(38-40) synthase TruA [Candidatus Eremiobacterota bacterium]
MRFRLLVEYEGTRYRGWQVQPGCRTVQGELVKAAESAAGKPVRELMGAGRTDAGVHALGQVAHLDLDTRIPPATLLHRLNDALPPDIAVVRLEVVPARFHARHDAVSRTYLYQISRRRTAFGKKLVWWVKDPLDLESMRAAAGRLAALRDFAGFTAAEGETRVDLQELSLAEVGSLVLVRARASHFLWKMVRRLVGALVEVGRGAVPPARVAALRSAEHTAPPSGLFLERVSYPGDPPDPPAEPVLRIRG